jgi:hypothetical protein
MLDEEEFSKVDARIREAFDMKGAPIKERFRPVCDLYEELTGFHEANHNAIMHHRISLYGPPCEQCGKPLRTPKAAFCAACGKVREAHPVR